jgi:hypothetical protein
MTAEIVKFPYSVSRRAHARKPRGSKNGTPEERVARAGTATANASDSFRDFVEHLSQLTAEAFPDFIARLRKRAGLD